MATTLKLGSMAVLLMGLQAIALGIEPARSQVEREPQLQSAIQWSAIPRIISNPSEGDLDVPPGDPETETGGVGHCVDF